MKLHRVGLMSECSAMPLPLTLLLEVLLMQHHALWIENQFVNASSSDTLTVYDPATEAPVGTVQAATSEDVDRAVAAAKAAFPAWRDLSADARVDLLHKVASRLHAAAPELAVPLTHETGRMLARNQYYIEWSARVFSFYAELARAEQGSVAPSADPTSQINLVLSQPFGVVACIVPWNYPILLLAWKLAPALAAGNTVVIKPASQTPLTTLLMMQAAFDHLPPGVVNVITGRGAATGDRLVRHPDVPLIAFTGSTEVGQHLMKLAIPHVKKLHLELGGKDPAIVCGDVDVETVVKAIAWGAFLNGGQVCTGIERVYVHESIADAFVEKLAALAGKLKSGSGFDPTTQITPMISAGARAGVHAMVQDAIGAGAKCLTGGYIPQTQGFFYPPTVLAKCNHSMAIMKDETFGPVVGVMPFHDLEEAIALANDSDYGLGAGLYTHDARTVHKVAREVETGTLWVNDPLVDNMAGPFGGVKMSGVGRELGLEGLRSFRQVKHVHWDLHGNVKPWWFTVETPS